MTWALEEAFPKLIREFQLPNDPVRLQQAITVAQERSSQDTSPAQVVHDLFATMGWPFALEQHLFKDVMTNYEPKLFDDALVFLKRLRDLNKRTFVLSNNPLSLKFVAQLQIEGYITGLYTPSLHAGTLPKPHRSLWDVIIASDSQVNAANSAFVGDDPWADGGFAENCGLNCWIVDRHDRFGHLRGVKPFTWVPSLLEIPLL